MFGTTVRAWPGMCSTHTVVPRVAEGDTPLVTGELVLSAGFSGHRRLVHDGAGAAAVTADLPPGTATVTGSAPVRWLRTHEPAEALEVRLERVLVARALGADRLVEIEPRVGAPDVTLLAVASRLRAAHLGGAPLDDVAASSLAHRLVVHLLEHYAGVALEPPPRGLLPSATVERVAEFVESGLHNPMTLDDLAAVAHLSPQHFARAFARTTGLPPHRFVAARRMDRARRLLRDTNASVEEIARAVGHENLSHFRRVFRAHLGASPTAWRGGRVSKNRPGGAGAGEINIAGTDSPREAPS